ncbi:MAG TPA: CsbD family protein [Acetobacteraceae bacterium]|nr:CsbD family protein [Acetobacteraceae bacterium]
MVDTDRIKGIGHQIKGTIKEAVGKLTGDAAIEAEGKAEKAAGKMQNAIGGVKDKTREMLDK